MRRTQQTYTGSEIIGIIRSLGYLANEAQISGMNDVAEYIMAAMRSSGDWALKSFSENLENVDRYDQLQVIQLLSRFMASSEMSREAFLERIANDSELDKDCDISKNCN